MLLLSFALWATLTSYQPVDGLIKAQRDPQLKEILTRVVENHPDILQLQRQYEALLQKAPQVKALPDPMVGLTWYLLTPETRVGPQKAMTTLSQRFPWFGKLKLEEQAVLLEAAAVQGEIEAKRIILLTRAEKLYYDLSFLKEKEALIRQDLETLKHFERLARTRYAAGTGLQQGIIKIQAEITRDENRLLEITQTQKDRLSALNALQQKDPETPLDPSPLPHPFPPKISFNPLYEKALENRPELKTLHARIQAWKIRQEIARKNYYPDITVGLMYTSIASRQDADPEDNGKDILGIGGNINLPIWRDKLASGVEETIQRELSESEKKRSLLLTIQDDLGDWLYRLPLIYDQWELFATRLVAQAQQALNSALSAYSAGNLNALDLLDSERILLEVKIGEAQTRAAFWKGVAELEGILAYPLKLHKGASNEK